MSLRLNKTKALILIFSIFLFDQFTKYLAFKFLASGETIKILPFLNLVYIENIGTVFGLFKFLGSKFFIIISLIIIGFLIYICFKDPQNQLVYSLIIAGAFGNIADRLIHGHVIDFIDFHVDGFHWPAFNIADSVISIGIVLFIYKSSKIYKALKK